MLLTEFIAMHGPALGRNEARHNLILGLLERWAEERTALPRTWTLGPPGACAVATPGRPIVLGELERRECHALADAVRDLDYAGVVGPDDAPRWFVERALELGHAFEEPMPQRIYALSDPAVYPGSPGTARQAVPEQAPLLLRWMANFAMETNTNPAALTPGAMARQADDYTLWWVEGAPVAMASISRRTSHTGAISGVYTPPEHRRQGYGGSVTAAVADRIHREGKTTACLYTDLRNAFSNRCYAKVGFKAVCDSHHFPRVKRR